MKIGYELGLRGLVACGQHAVYKFLTFKTPINRNRERKLLGSSVIKILRPQIFTQFLS